jgi:hypothetical protein
MKRSLVQTLRQAGQIPRSPPDAGTDPIMTGGLRISLAELIQLHGKSSGPVLMILLAVLATLPIAGTGTVLSLGIFLLALSWLRGMDNMPLPKRLGQVTLNPVWTRRCLHSLAWIYEKADLLLRPRWIAMSNRRLRRAWGAWIALMAALIFIPLPFGNVLPAMSLVMLSLGWMTRDGLALMLAGVAGVGAIIYVISFSHLVVEVVQRGLVHLFV